MSKETLTTTLIAGTGIVSILTIGLVNNTSFTNSIIGIGAITINSLIGMVYINKF